MWSRSASRTRSEPSAPPPSAITGAWRLREQPQHQLLLALAERGLALAVEERLDRLPELALELAVGVERLDAELGRHRARGARLAGAHEADEHERARRRRRAGLP